MVQTGLHAISEWDYGKSMVYLRGFMMHENGYRFKVIQDFFW